MKKGKKKKRLKIRYGRILLVLTILGLIIYLLSCFINFPIKNIFISGNTILSDQEIIDIAGISDYPSIFSITNYKMEKNLKKNIFITDVKVTKKKLKEIYIEIEENYALFYNSSNDKTLLHNGKETKEILNGPILINYVPDNIYDDFVKEMKKIDREIINRISEIKYDPNNVDEERFLLTMNDGNYVYLTLIYYDKLNSYVDIIKNFEDKKGILYLDSGEYFKVYE